ncbi:MAG: response regulator [Bdellovibrionales bacterium]|nr:response regulator [Bdellovibrionales bacterium]
MSRRFYWFLRRIFRRVDGWILERLDRTISPNLTVRYLVGLSLIAVVAILGQALVQLSLVGQSRDYNQIRLAERQTVVSEEFGKSVLILRLSAGEATFPRQIRRTDRLFALLVQNHRMLMTGESEPKPVKPGAFEDEAFLGDAHREFRNLVEAYERIPRMGFGMAFVEEELHAAAQRLTASESVYRRALERLTVNYVHELRLQLQWFRVTELGLLVLTLLILVLEALYVFRPAVERMMKALRARSDFLGRMGHEIRNPMNAILGMADLLARTPLTSQQERYIDVLRKSGTGLVDLLNSLLDYSSLESGKVKLESIPFEPDRVVERVAEVCALGADAKGLRLVVDLDPWLPARLQGDPTRLQQVLSNVAGNAVKFTENGEVRISARFLEKAGTDRARIEFRVKDTGIGIEPLNLRRIFDGFVQEDSSIRRRFGGTGLGLSISQELVRLMGGSIEIASEKGRGSEFSFSIELPVVREGGPMTLGETLASADVMGARLKVQAGGAARRSLEPLERLARESAGTEWVWVEPGARVEHDARAVCLVDLSHIGEGREEAWLAPLREIEAEGWGRGRIVALLRPTAPAAAVATLGRMGYRQALLPLRPRELFEVLRAALQGREVPTDRPRIRPTAEPSAEEREGAPLRVLVVDDAEENLLVMEAFLEDLPCEARFAPSGEEALRLMGEFPFDLVLLDIHMPGMDGYETCAGLRELERERGLSRTTIVAVTAHEAGQGAAGFREKGFDEFLPKPIDVEVLRRLIRTQVKSVRRSDERAGIAPPTAMQRLEERIRRMAPDYLKDRAREVDELIITAERGDLEQVASVAHKIKGNARTFGFTPLGELGRDLETQARAGDAPAVLETLRRMREYLGRQIHPK